MFATFQEAMAELNRELVVEYRFNHADSSWTWLESHGLSRPGETHIGGFVINTREGTERKDHENRSRTCTTPPER